MTDSFEIQHVIDAMPDGVVVLGPDGTIRCVNRIWRDFSCANGGNATTFYVGENYLGVCRGSSESGSEHAAAIADGLLEVINGGQEFRAEYPCHSSSEKRWFTIIAKPIECHGERLALVSHRDISRQKLHQDEATYAEQNAKNLAAIVATMPDAVIAFDLQGIITSWNDAAKQLYGYDKAEIIGQSMEILYPEDWSTKTEDYIADIVANGRRKFEVVRKTKAGHRRTIQVTAAPFRSVSGEIVGVSNINRDVTEKRRAQKRLRDVLDNLFAFVGLLGPDGTLVEANRAALEAADLENEDVVGKKFWDCYWWNHSSDVQRKLQDACQTVLGGQAVRYDEQIRIAGEKLIWIDFQLAPLKNADGEVENLIPSGIDISERKASVEALRSSHDTFRNLVERSPFGIYTVDADFRLAHVSDGAQKAFVNVRPLAGHDFADALHILWDEPFASEAIGRFRHTLETGEPYRSQRTIEQRHDTDEREAYDWMIERITMPDGRTGVVCNFYDLSERLRYEERVQFLMREVNHRAKNLLTVVMSMARQTARDCSPQEFVERFSNRLLGLSASQDLIVQANWGGVTVRELINSQLRHLSEEVQSDRVSLAGPEFMLTPAAAQGIGMALHELSTNAIKYGSLSNSVGTIVVEWGTGEDNKMFHICWNEQDGPPVAPPEKSGFGRTVTEKMAAISVGGNVELAYLPTGVSWRLTAAIAKVLMQKDQEMPAAQ